jgi:ABC-type branched-subunit amino acid transport system substrate-binding protein
MILALCALPCRAASAPESGDRVVIGINVPTTGPYSAQGFDQKKAYELAIKRINAAGGLLGKRVEGTFKDTASKPEVAKANALEMVKKDGAVMLTGGSSSAVALALGDVAQENRVVFMAALTHSNATTGHERTAANWTVQKAHRNTFRWYFNAWMTAFALGPYLTKELGADRSYFYITSDYTWGHSLEESLRYITESKGAFSQGTVRTPLGKTDFRQELQQAAKTNPDVLMLVLFGNDLVTALKQAQEMGLKSRIQVVAPLIEMHIAKMAGFEAMEGVLATTNWSWTLKDRFPGSKEFVDAFNKEYGAMPGEAAATAWVAIQQWASAVQRAGSFHSGAVVRALEGHSFTLLKDKEQWRDWDHQAISSVLVVKGKGKNKSKGEWDLLDIVAEVPGDKVMPTREENPVVLEPLD